MHYFFKYPNEIPFVIDDERQAWNLLRNTSNWQKKGLTYIGQSKGILFTEIMASIKATVRALEESLNIAREELAKYMVTKDKFKFDSLLDENDPKMIKVSLLITEKEEETQKLTKEIEKANKEVHTKAFQAELEEAEKNPKHPNNFEKEFALNEKNLDINVIK